MADRRRAFRGVRPHPVLRVEVRVLRVRHVDRSRASDRCLSAGAANRDRPSRGGRDADRSTVFVGGGTPTLVRRRRLAAVIAAIPAAADAEITVECNPDDVTVEMLATYRHGGVNRVSLGVQSMSAHVLAALGRTHDQRERRARAVEAIVAAEMPSFNLDLIYGAVGENGRRLALDRRVGTGIRSATHLGLRAHGRGGHAACRAAGSSSRRR